METEIKLKLVEGAYAPEYQTEGSAGADVRALLHSPLELAPGERCVVPTGIFLEIPQGYEVQVRPRSGLARKNGITVLNSPGTIDSDYRGELQVLLVNLGDAPFTIQGGDRIAQIVVAPTARGAFKRVESLSETPRGEGGFGHTGI